MARRIVYQLVAPMEKTLGVAEMERRRDYLQRHAGVGTQITVQSVPAGYPSIESERDAVMVAPHLMSAVSPIQVSMPSARPSPCRSSALASRP